MEALALALGAVLVVACVVFVARPLLREAAPEEEAACDDGAEEARLRLLERRDRALAALKELEFDHRTGKVSDEDYRALVGPLRHEAAEALGALESRDRREREDVTADVVG